MMTAIEDTMKQWESYLTDLLDPGKHQLEEI